MSAAPAARGAAMDRAAARADAVGKKGALAGQQYHLSLFLYYTAVLAAAVLTHHAVEVPARRLLRLAN